MTTWPASLPQTPLQSGFVEDLPRLTVATEMDAGPSKVRRRFTAGVIKYTMEFSMDSTQVVTFREFFIDTTKGGSVKFNFPDLYAGSTSEFRFDVSEGVPQIKPEEGRYRVSVKMEKLP